MISLTRSAEFWPNIDIKRRIRRVFNQRILHFISKFGHDSRQDSISEAPVNNILLIFSLLLASSINSQNTLGEYSDDEGIVENESNAEKVNVTSDCEKCVIPYTRVSTDEQEKNGRSIDSQREEISSIIERDPEMTCYREFIEDKGESGTNFNRPGIQKVAARAEDPEVTHIIVDTIDRIGRNVSKTLMFIENMRENYDVKILQKENEFDILNPEDKMVLNNKVMIAEFSTQNRARSSKRSSADNFVEDKQWCSWYRQAPFGYKIENKEGEDPESKGWIEKVDDMGDIIKEIFNKFIEKQAYSAVREHLNDEYAKQINEYKEKKFKPRNDNGNENEKQESTKGPMSRGEIKPIITNPVYKGKPMISVTDLHHYDSEPFVDDSDLEFISESTFVEAQEIVTDIHDKNSTNNDQTLDADEYANEFDPYVIETVSPQVKLVCPKCSSDLNCNGYIRKIDLTYGNREYECANDNCDYTDRWPKTQDKNKLEILTQMEEFDMIT